MKFSQPPVSRSLTLAGGPFGCQNSELICVLRNLLHLVTCVSCWGCMLPSRSEAHPRILFSSLFPVPSRIRTASVHRDCMADLLKDKGTALHLLQEECWYLSAEELEMWTGCFQRNVSCQHTHICICKKIARVSRLVVILRGSPAPQQQVILCIIYYISKISTSLTRISRMGRGPSEVP